MSNAKHAIGLYGTLGVGFSALADVLTGFNNFSGEATAAVVAPVAVALLLCFLVVLDDHGDDPAELVEADDA